MTRIPYQPSRPVAVAVLADETSAADLSAYLRRAPGVRLLPDGCAATAEVLLVLAREVGPALVGELKAVTSAASRSRQRVVLIAETVHESHMPELIGCGVVSILPRRLNYSARTIKKIIQSILTRFDLRNRSHAVSFAIRAGAI
jgi:DNA-binding NarL/FixJ family response regulator